MLPKLKREYKRRPVTIFELYDGSPAPLSSNRTPFSIFLAFPENPKRTLQLRYALLCLLDNGIPSRQ